MPPESPVTIDTKKCRPFLLRVMVFSPESGYKFIIEVQKDCTASNEEVWKLLFSLFKKSENQFAEIMSVEFVAGDSDEIERVAAITDEEVTRSQVRAFRDKVYPLTKSIGDKQKEPTEEEQQVITNAMRDAVMV